jgi:hypothetical protein
MHVAQAECRTNECDRAGQISGDAKGYCCWLCIALAGSAHANICNMIEEAGRADLAIGNNIVLGYN